MEEIVAQVEKARATGIDAWDCSTDEEVLVVPWILAFQGDNPTASEFFSHIGTTGKYFCRVWHVGGPGAAGRSAGEAGEQERLSEFITVGTACQCL